MPLPKTIILDRDGVCNYASSNPDSPLYYVRRVEELVIKVGVKEAVGLLRAHNIPLVLATKQKCISKGLVSRQQVDLINARLDRLLDAQFQAIYVEESAEDKSSLYRQILKEGGLRPDEAVLFDDSPREVKVAQTLGITAYDGSDLLTAVRGLLNIS